MESHVEWSHIMSSIQILALVVGAGAIWPFVLILLLSVFVMCYGAIGGFKKKTKDQSSSIDKKQESESPQSPKRRTQ